MKNPKFSIETARFLRKAVTEGISVTEISKSPCDVSKKLGLKMNDEIEREILMLSDRSIVEKINIDDAKTISFLNKVLVDGRYVMEWQEDPCKVARELNLEMDNDLEAKIKKVNFDDLIEHNPDDIARYVGIASFIIAVIVIANAKPGDFPDDDTIVYDFSDIPKF